MRRLPLAISLLVIVGSVRAQDGPVRFVAKAPFVRLAVHDAPGFLDAISRAHLGRLVANDDLADALSTAMERFGGLRRRWSDAVTALEALDVEAVDWSHAVQKELWTLDWRDVRGGEIIATHGDRGVQTTVLLEPTAAAEGRLAQRFVALADVVWKQLRDPDAGERDAAGAKIDGFDARVLPPRGGARDRSFYEASGAWFVHLPGQFAAGTGDPGVAGQCRAAPTPSPAVSLEIDATQYVRMISSFVGTDSPFRKVLGALGLGETFRIEWRIEPRGELLHDEISLEFGEPRGLIAALVHAAAPLVDQPLPEDAMLQVRLAFDVRELVAVADELLELNGMPTLRQLGLTEELHKAWTGGIALAVCAPPEGTLVPRVFASFGIVDTDALDRLLVRLTKEPGFERKDVVYEDQPCVQLRPVGAPPALSPTWCVKNGAIHFAESGGSLRAMLKAAPTGTGAALDVGGAPRPQGKGAIVPGFDLRYDAAAIYAALRDTWLPVLALTQSRFGNEFPQPVLSREELPEADAIAEHLTRGRGVLRQHEGRLVLALNGSVGGPELLALLTMLGPALSPNLLWSWQWDIDAMLDDIARAKLQRLHAAIGAFTKRTGKRPESLADLIGTEISDGTMLAVEGDEPTEPVTRDGKEVARTSFRYYRDGIEVAPTGDAVMVHLISIGARQRQRLAIGLDGKVHEGYGPFANVSLDELERRR